MSTPRILSAATVLLALMLPTLAVADETPSIRRLTAEEITALQGGDTVVVMQSGMPVRGEVIGLIHAPLAELAPILTDYPHITEWAPATEDIVVVGTEGNATLIEGRTVLPLLVDRTWRMRSRAGYEVVDGEQAFVYRFDHVPGTGNINTSFGYWVLYSLDEDPSWTYVRYVANADAGIAIPSGVIRWVTGRALPDLIDGLRERHDALH